MKKKKRKKEKKGTDTSREGKMELWLQERKHMMKY